MEKKLKQSAIKGVKWTTVNTLFNALSTPLFQIVLAMLLIPDEFAYIAVIAFFVGLSNLLSDVGIGEAVIQRDNVNNLQLSSLFYFNGIIVGLLSIILFVTSPYIELFYNLDNLENIIKLIIITIILNGFSSLFRVYLQRNMLFKEYSILQILKNVVDMISTVLFIVLGFGIFGYVYGTIIATIMYVFLLVVITYKKTDIKILFYFSLKEVKPFLNFGLSIYLKKSLTYVSQRLDEIIIGGTLSPDILGVYYFGKRLLMQLQAVITNAFSQLLLPLFSRMKNDLTNLKNTYLKITKITAIVGFPVFTGIALTAHLFIPVLFSEQWIESVNVIRILSIAMVLQVVTANITTSMLYSINKPLLVLIIDIFMSVLYFLGLILFSQYGLLIILVLFCLYTIMKAIILQYFVGRSLNYSLLHYINHLSKIIISTLIMIVAVLLTQNYILGDIENFIQLLISVLVGALSYSVILYYLDRKEFKTLLSLILKK